MKFLQVNKANGYLWLILLVSLPLGSYLLPVQTGVITLSAFRFTLIGFFLFQALSRQWFFPRRPVSMVLMIFMAVFLAYASVWCLWAPQKIYAIKEVFYLLIGCAIVYQVLFFTRPELQLSDYGIKAFFIGLAIIIGIGTFEFLSLKHLPSDFSIHLSHLTPNHTNRLMPFATFGNPNNLAVYLVFSIILLRAYQRYSNTQNFLTLFFSIMAIGLLILTRSKISIAALIVYFAFEGAFYLFQKKNFIRKEISKALIMALSITALLAMVVIGGKQLEPYFQSKDMADERESEFFHFEPENIIPDSVQKLGSGTIRFHLALNGLEFFKQSKGLGNGPGSFRHMIENGQGPYPTQGIVNPHSWIIKLLANFGLPITLLFVAWMIWCLVILVKGILKLSGDSSAIPWLLLSGGLLLSYPLLSNAPSAFINNTINWLMLASLAIASDNILKKLKEIQAPEQHIS